MVASHLSFITNLAAELRMQQSAYFVNIVCACVARGAVV